MFVLKQQRKLVFPCTDRGERSAFTRLCSEEHTHLGVVLRDLRELAIDAAVSSHIIDDVGIFAFRIAPCPLLNRNCE
jgi:hypothetical protein